MKVEELKQQLLKELKKDISEKINSTWRAKTYFEKHKYLIVFSSSQEDLFFLEEEFDMIVLTKESLTLKNYYGTRKRVFRKEEVDSVYFNNVLIYPRSLQDATLLNKENKILKEDLEREKLRVIVLENKIKELKERVEQQELDFLLGGNNESID